MLLGLAFLFGLAVVDVTLTVPSYSHSKAFFALSGLMTLAALAGLGFEFWSLRSRVTHWIFCIALGAWMLNVFASFWIRPDTIPAQLSSALAQVRYVNNDDTDAFARILEEDPGNVPATIVWASQKSRDNPDAALARLEEAARKHPAEAELEANLALALAGKGRMDEAIVDAKHASGLAPDNRYVFATWSQLALRQKNYADAETAARAAVGLNPTDNTSRFCLAWSLLNLGKFDQSEIQFAALVEARPDWADAHYGLAMSLLNLRGRQGEGLSQLKEAVRLNPQRKDWQDALARVVQGR
jgi:tetratricopeptide (TPR) repeat protein